MHFRLEHSADQTKVTGLAIVFGEDEIPQLRRMIDLLDRGGKLPLPKPYEPLYRREGENPETMYAKPEQPAPAKVVAPPRESLAKIAATPKLRPKVDGKPGTAVGRRA